MQQDQIEASNFSGDQRSLWPNTRNSLYSLTFAFSLQFFHILSESNLDFRAEIVFLISLSKLAVTVKISLQRIDHWSSEYCDCKHILDNFSFKLQMVLKEFLLIKLHYYLLLNVTMKRCILTYLHIIHQFVFTCCSHIS